MKVFLSKSFARRDRDLNAYFEGILRAVGVDVETADGYSDEPVAVKVERLLRACDFLVGIYVIRYEDNDTDQTLTSQWVMRETYTVHGQGKAFIVLVEDGVDQLGGLDHDRELIFFKRDDMHSIQDATIKFLQALRWHGIVDKR